MGFMGGEQRDRGASARPDEASALATRTDALLGTLLSPLRRQVRLSAPASFPARRAGRVLLFSRVRGFSSARGSRLPLAG